MIKFWWWSGSPSGSMNFLKDFLSLNSKATLKVFDLGGLLSPSVFLLDCVLLEPVQAILV